MRMRGLTGLLAFGMAACSQGMNAENIGPLDNGTEYSVEYSDVVRNNLLHVYEGKRNELPICLLGEERNSTYFITDIKIPFIIYSGIHSADYYLCNRDNVEGYLGMVHNHNENCAPSAIDMVRLLEEGEAKIEAIVCGPQNISEPLRINTWIKENLSESLRDVSIWQNYLSSQKPRSDSGLEPS